MSTSTGVWVFGYGSLVSPDSFGRTLGRTLRPGVDFMEAELVGFGRRWNYGVAHSTGIWTDPSGAEHARTIVALGVVASPREVVNGVVGWVGLDELAALDRRERDYTRADVSAAVATAGGLPTTAPVMVYVPRPEAIDRYETARDTGAAAVDHGYWNLVDAAFMALGHDRHAHYHATTPAPDVPVLPLVRR